MKTILFAIALCAISICAAFSQTKSHKSKGMNTIVLVHGAFLDASCWDKVVPALKAAGHEVITVNLPGHGSDKTPFAGITLQSYADVVKQVIGKRTNITLVGHSMGGMVVSQVAEQIPAQIGKLVYLGAFIPRNGESLLQLSSVPENKGSLLGGYSRPDEKTGSISVAGDGLIETFAADAPKAIADKMLAANKPDPLAPFVMPVSLTDGNFGRISKTYIYTINDKAIAYANQQLMVRNSNVSRSYSIPASHTPFFSMPGVVAAIILKEAGQPAAPAGTASAGIPAGSLNPDSGTGTTADGLLHSPAELVGALHTAFGNNHSRAVHAKGIILKGEFTPDPNAASLSKAFHLQREKSQVIVRFSNFTGIPTIPDNIGPANPRGLAVKFIMSDGTSTDIISHSFNGFPTANSDQFRELLLAIAASGPEAPKPTQLDKFLETHPVAKHFLTTQRTPASYATISYFGVNAFRFTNKSGRSHFIRYQIIPEAGEQLLAGEQIAAAAPDYLSSEIKDRIKKQHIRFRLYAQIAAGGDIIDNPSVTWPDTRRLVRLGSIDIQQMADNTTTEDKELSFSPNNIPAGIETADPMLDFRTKAYPISVAERQ